MDERLKRLEEKQMDVMMRLTNLSMGVEALRNKTEQNRQMAKDAKAQANNATQLATSLQQVSELIQFTKGGKYCRQRHDFFTVNKVKS